MTDLEILLSILLTATTLVMLWLASLLKSLLNKFQNKDVSPDIPEGD